MDVQNTTAAIQRYLDALAGARGDTPVEPLVRDLLAGAAGRLHVLCAAFLHRSYPRLTRPPLNLDSEEMLGAVVERLLKALREARPHNVRQFFALANQHMRWELNGLARSLDGHTPTVSLPESALQAHESGGSRISDNTLRILGAIEGLPDDEREAFDLVRIQGLQHNEAADILGVSTKTVQRRLNRSLMLLSASLGDLEPSAPSIGDP